MQTSKFFMAICWVLGTIAVVTLALIIQKDNLESARNEKEVEAAKHYNIRVRDAAFAAGDFNDPKGFQKHCGKASGSTSNAGKTFLFYYYGTSRESGAEFISVTLKKNHQPEFMRYFSVKPKDLFPMDSKEGLQKLGCS